MQMSNQEYKTLKRIMHEDSSNSRHENNKVLAKQRRRDISAYKSGIYLRTGELFYVVPQELSILNEKVLRLERKISQLWRNLPTIALGSYIRDLIIQEVEFTNQIEGVRSTRKEIENALEYFEQGSSFPAAKRFREFAGLYLHLTEGTIQPPKTPADIRSIYDKVMDGELEEKDQLDGKLFRKNSVEVFKGHNLIHEGVNPEAEIVNMLQSMIDMLEDESVPALYSSVLSHFIFEYIHPFYDGNGRTGRFLLALYLSTPLSIATTLSLSRTIAESLDVYYRVFEEVEHPLNHGDATIFLIEMFRLIRTAQESLERELEAKRIVLEAGEAILPDMNLRNGTEQKIVHALFQVYLFGTYPLLSLDQLADYLSCSKATARRHLSSLEEAGMVRTLSQKPLRFALTDESFEVLANGEDE